MKNFKKQDATFKAEAYRLASPYPHFRALFDKFFNGEVTPKEEDDLECFLYEHISNENLDVPYEKALKEYRDGKLYLGRPKALEGETETFIVKVTPDQVELLKKLGKGNKAMGFRALIKEYQDRVKLINKLKLGLSASPDQVERAIIGAKELFKETQRGEALALAISKALEDFKGPANRTAQKTAGLPSDEDDFLN